MTMAPRETRALYRIRASLCTSVAAYPRELFAEQRLAMRTSAQSVCSHPARICLEFLEW
jgi:hypothetical protein